MITVARIISVGGIVLGLTSALLGFDYDREVGDDVKAYYQWHAADATVRSSSNPYMAALNSLRLMRPPSGVMLSRNVTRSSPSLAPYENYVRLVLALQAGRVAEATAISPLVFDGATTSFITQRGAMEWARYYVSKRRFGEAKDILKTLQIQPGLPPIKEVLETMVALSIDDRDAPKAIQHYQQLISLYPESDLDQHVLDRIRRQFGYSGDIVELLNTPDLRADYVHNLYRSGNYRNLTQYYLTAEAQRAEFGPKRPRVLSEVALSFIELSQLKKARDRLFVMAQIPGLTPDEEALAKTFHSKLVIDSGDPSFGADYAANTLRSVIFMGKTATMPMAFYTYAQLMTSANQPDAVADAQAYVLRYIPESDPYILKSSWDRQRLRSAGGQATEFPQLERRLKSVLKSQEIVGAVFRWLDSRFTSSDKVSRPAAVMVGGYRSVPLSYHAIWALRDWGSVEKNATARASLDRHPDVVKYTQMVSMGLGQMALDEIDYRLIRQPSDSLKYARLTVLLKMGRFGKALAQVKRDQGGQGTSFYPIPAGWIDKVYPKVYWGFIVSECQKYKLDPYFVLAILREDSAFEAHDIQTKDTTHLFRIKDDTIKQISVRFGEWGGDPVSLPPEKIIKYGVYYIAWLRDNFDNNLLYTIMAYGTNPELAAQLIHGSSGLNHDAFDLMAAIPYPETRDYVQRVLDTYVIYSLIYPDPSISFKRWKLHEPN